MAMAVNFLEIFQLIGQHNDIIGKRLVEMPRNRSNDIQNELMDIVARMGRSGIAEEAGESAEFSVMADESKTAERLSKCQSSFCIFFVGQFMRALLGLSRQLISRQKDCLRSLCRRCIT